MSSRKATSRNIDEAKSGSRGSPQKGGSKCVGQAHMGGKTKVKVAPSDGVQEIPIELQQLIVNVFMNSFLSRFSASLNLLLQEIKGHLYNRRFQEAFGKQEYLEAYVVRWSPSRALGYLSIFYGLARYFVPITTKESSASAEALPGTAYENVHKSIQSSTGDCRALPPSYERSAVSGPDTLKIVCLGGGAGAEIVALAGLLNYLRISSPGDRPADVMDLPNIDDNSQYSIMAPVKFSVTAVDVADWSLILDELRKGVTTAPAVSKYASSSAKASNRSLLCTEECLLDFQLQDLLNFNIEDLSLLLKNTRLITLMFTLNELYSTSIAKATSLLVAMSTVIESGTLLLVVDSPGSYSTVAVGSSSSDTSDTSHSEKEYPMQFLLDHTLLRGSESTKSGKTNEEARWEKLISNESKWFRLPVGLKYPIELENMRYQIHLYRRI